MKSTVNQYHFEQAFRDCGRFGGDNDNFSYEALQLLFNWFEEYEESGGTEIELDPIAICCEFAEMTKAELLESYSLESLSVGEHSSLNVDWFNVLNDEEQTKILQDALEEKTSFIGKTDPSSYSKLKEPTFVFQSF